MAVELATAYVSIVPSAQGIGASIAKELAPVESAAATTGAKAGSSLSGGIFGAVNKEASSAISPGGPIGNILGVLGPTGTIAAAGLGLGAVLFSAASDVDSALDTIQVSTGATGKVLDGLGDSFKNVAANTPSSFSDISATLAEVYQRTGLTGPALEGLTTQVLDFNRTTKDSPINVKDLTLALAGFNVPAKDSGKALDGLFRTSQATGVPLAELISTLNTAGPTARQFGFNASTTAGLLAELNRAGVDFSGIMPGLRKAFIGFAKDGKEPAAALKDVIGQMDGLVKAGDIAGARNLAVQTFGARGVGLVDAAVSGKLSLEDLSKTFATSGDGIIATAKKTDDAGESFKTLGNNAKLIGAELGKPIFELVSQGLKDLVPLAHDAAKEIQAFLKWGEKSGVFAAFGEAIKGAFNIIVRVVKSAFDVLKGVFDFFDDLVHGRWGQLWDDFVNIIKGVLEGVPGIILGFIAKVGSFLLDKAGDLIKGLVTGLVNALPDIANFFLELPGKILAFFADAGLWLLSKGLDLLAGLLAGIVQKAPEVATWFANLPLNVLTWIADTAGTLIPKGIDFIAGLIGGLIEKAVELATWVQDLPGKVLDWLGDVTDKLLPKGVDFLVGLIQGFENKVGDVLSWVTGLPGKIVEAVGDLSGRLVDAGKSLIGGLWEGIKAAWNAAADLATFDLPKVHIPGTSVDIGGGTISLLPHLAVGGLIKSAGMAWVGEQGPEAVLLPAGAAVLPSSLSQGLATQPATAAPSMIHVELTLDGEVIARRIVNPTITERNRALVKRASTRRR